jgi:hypothetical protein
VNPNTQTITRLLPGYATLDWETYQIQLRNRFCSLDNRYFTANSLKELVSASPKQDIRDYILMFTEISHDLDLSLAIYDIECPEYSVFSLQKKGMTGGREVNVVLRAKFLVREAGI